MLEPEDKPSITPAQEHCGPRSEVVMDAIVDQSTISSKCVAETEGIEHPPETSANKRVKLEEIETEGTAQSEQVESVIREELMNKPVPPEESTVQGPAESAQVRSAIPEETSVAETHASLKQKDDLVTDQIVTNGHSDATGETSATYGHTECNPFATLQAHERLDTPGGELATNGHKEFIPVLWEWPRDERDAQQSNTNDRIHLDSAAPQMEQHAQGQVDPTSRSPDISDAQMPDVTTIPPSLTRITTQIAPPMVPDVDFTDEAYAESLNTSYVTSIASEVSRGVVENERLYPSYGQHRYGMPIDEDEKDRMDLQHGKYALLLGGRHFLAPIGPAPKRILDLGTGTGMWALDMADEFPAAQILGVDIAPIQPPWVPANCSFEIDDIEATWTYKLDHFDFIHFRDPLYCVRDWPRLAAQCYDHLKPGGWCEIACIYPVVMCDDGSMPDDSGFKTICERFMEASAIFGTPTDSPIRFARFLREAGFVDVSENIFKIPSSPWPRDKRLKKIGAMEMTNVCEGSSAFALRAFEKAYGWTREQTELAMIDFKRDVRNRNYHQYCQ